MRFLLATFNTHEDKIALGLFNIVNILIAPVGFKIFILEFIVADKCEI